MPRVFTSSRLVPLAIAIILTVACAVVAHVLRYPSFVNIVTLTGGTVSDAQAQAVGMVKELNTYLVSTTTLLLGGLGWYFSQYAPPKSRVLRTAFFASVGFVTLAYIYAGLTNVELTDELAQDSLALKPQSSLVLFYLETEIWACGVASVLMLWVFAEAVTKEKQ
jgi:hypothetical protein